jgi:hypothetical protein
MKGDEMDWRKIKCPKCEKQGLHYASHPHAYGWKDYDVVVCRFCHNRYDSRKLEKYVESKTELEKETK